MKSNNSSSSLDSNNNNDPSYKYVLSFSNIPCFRTSLLWGIGLGSVIALHQFRVCKNVIKSCDYGVRMFGISSIASWVICRSTYFAKKEYQKEIVRTMNIPEEKRQSSQYYRSEPVPCSEPDKKTEE